MSYSLSSVFAENILEHVKLLGDAGRYVGKARCYLRSLDLFLAEQGVCEKALDEGLVTKWLSSKPVKPATKAIMLYEVGRFAKYLASLGFPARVPETPRVPPDYLPYIFTKDEFERIIYAADNFMGGRRVTKASFLFPVLLRMLYGCGLRLGEGLALAWKNIDLDNGVITIRVAKNKKQRFVPVSPSLNEILKEYRRATSREGICRVYLFETEFRYGKEKPYQNCAFGAWFARVLRSAGIGYAKKTPHERGPCPHCMRHLFVFDSFLKSEREGRAFDETAPVLSAYLGHENLFRLEKYLRADYSLYKHSHARVSEYINDVFPEVSF
jgi:integrase